MYLGSVIQGLKIGFGTKEIDQTYSHIIIIIIISLRSVNTLVELLDGDLFIVMKFIDFRVRGGVKLYPDLRVRSYLCNYGGLAASKVTAETVQSFTNVITVTC